MPFYRLKEYIKYKDLERGIDRSSEYNTSKRRSRCGSINTERHSQELLICKTCGYKINADVNGAKNILTTYGLYAPDRGAVTWPEGEHSFVLHTNNPNGVHVNSVRWDGENVTKHSKVFPENC